MLVVLTSQETKRFVSCCGFCGAPVIAKALNLWFVNCMQQDKITDKVREKEFHLCYQITS